VTRPPPVRAGAAQDDDEEVLAGEAGEALAAAASRGRVADRELAAALNRPEPAGAAPTAGYLEVLGRRPVLPEALERELVAAAQDGDHRARARLVEAFMPQIASMARLYRQSPRVDRVELLQEGVVGLLRALERYDVERDIPFWAYASWWVRQAMQQLVAELTRPVVLSDRALRRLARVREAHHRALQETGREPGRDELAERTGLPRDQLDDLLAADSTPRSIEEPVTDEEEGLVSTLGELLVDPLAEGEYQRVLEAMEAQELLSLLAVLSDRERAVLRARHGLEGRPEESQREIAAQLGVSAERVRQVERRALEKLAAAGGGNAQGA
jgi:RNA polymerase sigma factor (sigma-70 family)